MKDLPGTEKVKQILSSKPAKVKLCPFCRDERGPTIGITGHVVDISCSYCPSYMLICKKDFLTPDEIKTYDGGTYLYSLEAEIKILAIIIKLWNTRKQRSHKYN